MSLVSIEETIKVIANQFDVEGEVLDISRFGSGHINDTYKLTVSPSKDISYLLQKINHHIFTDVDGLLHTISLVTNHLKTVLKGTVEDVDKHTLTIVPTKDRKLYHVTPEGEYWRIFILLEDTKSYDIVETTKQAYSGGQAFGKFQKQLETLDATKLVEILPNFHNIDFRLNNLRKAISKDSAGRVAAVEDILIYIFERENKMRRILELAKSGQLPLRITRSEEHTSE